MVEGVLDETEVAGYSGGVEAKVGEFENNVVLCLRSLCS